jgi:hypothetical protein
VTRLWRHRLVLAILGAGLLLRIVLAFIVFPGQGLASDLGLFESWASTLAQVGPGAFYATAGTANYPPGYLYVLWLVGALGEPAGHLLEISSGQAIVLMLKIPAIAADVGLATLLYLAGRRWYGQRAGLLAAAVYLFVPVTWYDSALWGQVDAVGALVMLAALVLLIEGWSEPAAALAAFGVLVKPQDAILLVVVVPILLRRHLFRVGSGPRVQLGRSWGDLNRRLGGLLQRQGPVRLATSAVAAAVVGITPLIPFDIGRWAPASLAEVPVVGHVAGLVALFVSVGGQFSVLTANAYNAWALVGPDPLSAAIGVSGASWTPDSLILPGGLSAVTVGALLLVAVGLAVAGGLLARDDRLAILLGFSLVVFAFYAVPTRVHERYLFPFFASGALLAAGAWPTVSGLVSGAAGYLGVGFLNAVNLHSVLAAPLSIGGGFGMGGGGAAGSGPGGGPQGLIRGGALGGPGGPGGAGGPGFGGGSGASSISLPFADVARSEAVVVAVAVGQTAVLVALAAAWLLVVIRPRALGAIHLGPRADRPVVRYELATGSDVARTVE